MKSNNKWFMAFRKVFPFYLAAHFALLVASILSLLFTHPDFDMTNYPLDALWWSWNRWDTVHFTHIAQFGYDKIAETAFFPLYPLLIKILARFIHHNYLVAGLIISNTSLLVLSAVFYQIVKEDFDEEVANRSVLYISIFPTAFFLAAAYSESLCLCLMLLSFYQIRRKQWWLAGLFGFFASLARSNGILLIIPLLWEYLCQRQFRLKHVQGSILAILLIPAGTILYAIYCYKAYGDPLSFSHMQSIKGWDRFLSPPWTGAVLSIRLIRSTGGLLNYWALRNMLDLVPDLFIFLLLVLSIVGPWRFPVRLWSYTILGMMLWIFFNLYPRIGSISPDSLSSMSRFVLQAFPAFVFLARQGKHQIIHLCYITIATSMLFFMMMQFLSGHWIL